MSDESPATKRPGGKGPGQMIGDYRVVREIGRGGMGVVYEAEQQHPRRAVALKVISGEAYVDAERVRLFEREAQTLARLRHPDIAGIYESGRTADGRHFFAMELARGSTLEAYVVERIGEGPLLPAALRERLGIFARICQAVSYAHQRGVIHRDLKPTNILVTPDDVGSSHGHQCPGIKILDFGLARITHPDGNASQVTEVGVVRGTLAYMSPEQVRGETDDIDVRSDVYSLGVILYRLLTGASPYEVRGVPLHEATRIICELAPATLAENWRGARRPDEDLETIVGKALEKEPGRRYQSAAALAEDVSRYLNAQPILARPPSTAYQLRKLVLRHKVSFGFALVVLFLLCGFAVSMAIQARRVAAQRDRANQEAETARRVVDFLTTLFSVPDPYFAPEDMFSTRDVLDRGAELVRRDLEDQPAVQSRLMAVMSAVYGNVGSFEEAYDLADAAYRIQQTLHPEGHADVAQTLLLRATGQYHRGNYREAEELARQALTMQREFSGERHTDVASILHFLGRTLKVEERLDEAEAAYREALDIRREQLGEDQLTVSTMTSLAELLRARSELDPAETLHRQALEMARRLFGEEHPVVASCLNNLALVLQERRDFATAERYLREAVAIERDLYGDEDARLANSLNNLAALLRDVGKLDDAEALHREALAIRRRSLGAKHPTVAGSLNNLAVVLLDQGRRAEALPLMQEAIDIVRDSMGPEHERLGISLYNLGKLLHEERAYSRAAPLLSEAVPILERTLGPEHWRVGKARSLLGQCLLETQRPDEARQELVRGLEILIAARGENDPETQRAADRLEACLAQTGGD